MTSPHWSQSRRLNRFAGIVFGLVLIGVAVLRYTEGRLGSAIAYAVLGAALVFAELVFRKPRP